METIQLLGSTLGLAFVAGFRLYATVLAIGLSIRFGLYHPSPAMEHLRILASVPVLVTAGVAFVLEFVSDKIPWLDTAWDSFHTFIRPIGAALLGVAAFGSMDPALKVAVVLLCGGVALSSHSSKAAARVAVNHSPEPFSNIALSLAEDIAAPVGTWLAVSHPLVTLTLVAMFAAAFLWLSPKIFRIVRLQLVALRAFLSGPVRVTSRPADPAAGSSSSNATTWDPATAGVIERNAGPLPESLGRSVAERLKLAQPPAGLRSAAAADVPGLKHSIGYLMLTDNDLMFVTRRGFRTRLHRIASGEIRSTELKRGLLMHRMIVRTASGENSFYVFRDADLAIPEARSRQQATELARADRE
jgi:hypothetical protein